MKARRKLIWPRSPPQRVNRKENEIERESFSVIIAFPFPFSIPFPFLFLYLLDLSVHIAVVRPWFPAQSRFLYAVDSADRASIIDTHWSEMSTGELLNIEPLELKFFCMFSSFFCKTKFCSYCVLLFRGSLCLLLGFVVCLILIFAWSSFPCFSWAEEADLMFSSIVK